MVESSFENRVIVTKGQHALSNQIDIDLSDVSPCNHEEADTRIFLHVADAVIKGFKTLVVKANDTDMLVIAAAMFARLPEKDLHELWISYG